MIHYDHIAGGRHGYYGSLEPCSGIRPVQPESWKFEAHCVEADPGVFKLSSFRYIIEAMAGDIYEFPDVLRRWVVHPRSAISHLARLVTAPVSQSTLQSITGPITNLSKLRNSLQMRLCHRNVMWTQKAWRCFNRK
jgi:hypothetical protein